MTVLLFQPHYDDAVLFASYTLLDVKPIVVTVFGGETTQYPVVTSRQRQEENTQALRSLGIPGWQIIDLPHSEQDPNWVDARNDMVDLINRYHPDLVWAPWPELENGHDQHDFVGGVVGSHSVPRFYATYRRGSARTQTPQEVYPQHDWYARKFAAMACYTSQINLPGTRPWFNDWDREWWA